MVDPAVPSGAAVCVAGVVKSYRGVGDPRPVLSDLSLTVPGGQFCAIVGPSGTGKSTLLDLLAGLQSPDHGTVRVMGRDGARVLGAAAYMPQRDALLPWRTVEDNVALPLRVAGVAVHAARDRARDLLHRFGLEAYAGVRPDALSGGMRQRVAFLRTVAAGKGVLLLDEPFGALDALTRAELQDWLQEAWRLSGQTVLLVTHDVDEAVYLADRVLVLAGRPGRFVLDREVALSRPRGRDLTLTPAFAAIKAEVLRALGVAVRAPAAEEAHARG